MDAAAAARSLPSQARRAAAALVAALQQQPQPDGGDAILQALGGAPAAYCSISVAVDGGGGSGADGMLCSSGNLLRTPEVRGGAHTERPLCACLRGRRRLCQSPLPLTMAAPAATCASVLQPAHGWAHAGGRGHGAAHSPAPASGPDQVRTRNGVRVGRRQRHPIQPSALAPEGTQGQRPPAMHPLCAPAGGAWRM